MQTHTLSNDLLTVTVSSFGAELQSIRNNRTGEEYLWQGDSRFWGRRSPVLFPIVGSLWNNELHVDGKTFHMSQHGFARDMEFTPVPADDNSLCFRLESTDGTMEKYPFPFRLDITYTLLETRLEVRWDVSNTGSDMMPFQIGAHPAFNYPEYSVSDEIHGYFAFGHHGVLEHELIEQSGCLGTEKHLLQTDADGLLPLTDDTFRRDALIIGNSAIHRVSMLTPEHKPYLTLLFNSPLVGLWSKAEPSAPFVCIEPWWGRCDRVGFNDDITRREHINTIAPGDVFTASYTVLIDNI